ncbi:hypothetical protein MKW92_038039 [Papaver armeniacum]|nr:hypothetical protein MKW92_038039 [Papaver armeniacum]
MKIDHTGFSPVTPLRVKSAPFTPLKATPSSSEKKKTISSSSGFFHSPPCNIVSDGYSPYLKPQNVKDPVFYLILPCSYCQFFIWLQHDRADVVIEAIRSFRSLCSQQTQESLDYVLIDLYKRAGRINEHIELLQHKLQLVEDGVSYDEKQTKIARAQGKKYYCSIEHEKSSISRLLRNLGWAYMQQENYQLAEECYRKASSIEPDKNKECNLSICFMHKGKIPEAKSLLETVKPSVAERELADSYIKSFDRATEMLSELESGPVLKPHDDNAKMETQGSFTSPVKVNSSSPVFSRYVRSLDHSDSRVSSSATTVQQTCIRRCLDNSDHRVSPVSGQLQNHGFRGKWRADDSHLRISPSNGIDSDFGNWIPFGSFKSGKSWTDVIEEEEEEERLSRFRDYSSNTVDSLSEWSRKGSYRKPAARRSLYFDQKQEHEPSAQQYLHSNTHECAGSNRSTCSDSDSDSSDVHFPYDMDRFGETLKHELGDVKKGIKSVYVCQPPVHEKHKGGERW